MKLSFNGLAYDLSLIERVGSHLKKILGQVLENPGVKLKETEILTAGEKQQILFDFNRQEVSYPREKTIHDLYAEQVERTPDNIAVVGPSQIEYRTYTTYMTYISYRELNERSNQLAYDLIEKGVQTDTIVGIMMERCQEMIMGILGILKAGGAYLPIDPDYPGERKQYMLADSGTKILLSEELHPGFPASRFPGFPASRPSSLAYVIYTSGTTGKPKGTLITHGNVVRLLFNDQFQFDFSHRDVWTLFHSYCFDFSVWEMYGALLYGGKLVIIPKMTARDPQEFLGVLKRQGVTILNQTPSAFYSLVNRELEEPARDLRIRVVIFGGEALKPAQLKPWQERYPNTLLINMYGITETTVHVTYKEIGEKEIASDTSNIGIPIPTLTAYVMDRHMRLQPVGAAGQLYVGGEGVARGYLNRPGLTAEMFLTINNRSYKSYMSYIPRKVYKTGDLVRLLENLDMEYLGRIDQQVKIRGFRIEPGEIENRLLKQPGIKNAVVLAREDETRDRYLCAYIVTDRKIDMPGLKKNLAAELPLYMIPAYIIPIDEIPLTPNGKIDRKSLPAPGPETGPRYTAPRNQLEKKLVEIWSEVLGIEKGGIGIETNFFEVGGHSLKATILTAKIHKELSVRVPLPELFKHSTISELARYTRNLAENRYAGIEPVEKQDYYKLSSAQQRLYFLQQMDRNNTAYNMPLLLLLGKNIEQTRLESTLKKLISRHESLRTSFGQVDNEPVQRIHDKVEFEIEYYGAEHKAQSAEGKEEPHTRGTMHSASPIKGFIRPFDLSRAPLMRSGLVKHPDGHHTWIVDMHHIISDGTSHTILTRDFSALYSDKELAPLRLHYKDFSLWQNQWFASGEIKTQEEYWLRLFPGEIPRLDLPADSQRPEVFTFAGAGYSFELEKEDTLAFKTLGNKNRATLYMNFLAALNVLFYKYTGQEDIIIGSVLAGRHHADLQHIIGMFVNTLAMRNNPTGDKTYEYFLQEVVSNSLEAFENQDVQFEQLVEKLNLERDTSRNPLFDITMVVQNFMKPGEEEPGNANIQPFQVLPRTDENFPQMDFKTTTKFDMTFVVHEQEDNILVSIEYYTAIFKAKTLHRLETHFKNVIRAITANPPGKLRDIEIITREEKEEILHIFNDTARDYPRKKTIHRLFAEQVEKTPDQAALVGVSQPHEKEHNMSNTSNTSNTSYISHMSYKELNEKSQQLAHLLQEKGVRSDRIVILMAERRIEMVIGLLGILKAGGAYLPIDPGYPKERIDYLLRDSNAQALVVDDTSCASWLSFAPKALLNLSAGHHLDFPASRLPSFSASLFSSLAYVLYTSGTTGRPKGAAVEHIQVVNFLYHMYNRYDREVGQQDRCLGVTNIMFDVSVWEFFLPLTFGAGLVILPEQERFDVFTLAGAIAREQITLMYLPPALLEDVCQQLRKQRGRIRLNKMLVGVEPIRDEVLEGYMQLNPGMKIINGYGPTETTICATSYNYGTHEPTGEIVPIGVPLANTRVILLDAASHLTPPGIPGEICITGDSVTRGYINHPELTAEKFDRNLWNSRDDHEGKHRSYRSYKSNVFYKTGDIGHWLPDGNIEFLGRIDHQVKIRGFRIEPGEIENRLLKKPGIKNALVMAQEDDSKGKYLCAYIVSDEKIDPTALREYLAAELPMYMIPAYFIPIHELPLTPNGKIDRRALPKPGIETLSPYVAPRDEVEKELAAIWSELLGIENEAISIEANFFELGGHSLKATIMASQIYKTFNIEISLKEIFKASTIKAIAAIIKTLTAADNEKAANPEQSEEIIL